MILFYSWSYYHQKKQIIALARKEAETSFNKDVLYREWNARHGGVYVPVTPETPPNPYLHVDERDIETSAGKKLTLMNPAYMTRRVYALAREKYLIKGHITSLKPINPLNEPDSWEIRALQKFENGVPEYYEIVADGGQQILRFMRPFITQQACLKCHAQQGYRLGDIRGGISIAIPMEGYWSLFGNYMRQLFLIYLVIWLLGVVATVVVSRRIKKHNEEKRGLTERLNQAQKMEAIGTLAGGVAHDFNNLLTVINGYSEMALMQLKENERLYGQISAIKEAGKKAASLTSQLLAFSRKQIYKSEVLNINELVRSMEKMLRRLVGEDISIEVVLRENLPLIKGDKSQLDQILINLVVNARDAVREVKTPNHQKKITIETGQIILKEPYLATHPDSTPGLKVFFSVSDNGIGMDKETQKRIFEPFYTTKEKGKGTGLGLSTVYGIVKQNNGSIYVYSEPGKGTTIKIYWPACEETALQDRKAKKEIASYAGSETILLLEDDKDIIDFAATALSNMGYKVCKAGNGRQALELIESGECKFDLIITDLIMPELNGKDFVEKVKTMVDGVKVIFVSGYTDNHIVHNGMLEEGINFIHKPYSIMELAKTIRRVLNEESK